MKVKFKQSLAGADFSFGYGEIADIQEDWAKALLSSGLAEAVTEGGESIGHQNNSTTERGTGQSNGNEAVPAPRRKRS